jgi:hypothetical protein
VNNAESGVRGRFPFLPCLNTVFPIGILACLTFGSTDAAFAENNGLVARYAAKYSAGRPEKEAKSDPLSSGPLFAVVSIADQRISVYGSGGLVARAPVSTGVRDHPTPTGVFSIVQKRRWHRSNIYSSAPMPLMQRITWSGIALHAGVVPGHPASHGCIRLPISFAERLFGATEIGQRVIIAPTDTAPIEITHANLPAPTLSPPPSATVASAPEALDATASVGVIQQNDGAVLESVGLHEAPADAGRLNPLEFARAMKSEANSKARAAVRATKAASLLIAKKSTELRMAARKLAGAENAAEDAAGELAAAVRRLEKTDGKEAIAEASEAKSEAEADLIEAQKAKDARIAKATEAKNQAEAALTEAQKAAEEARIAKATETQTQVGAELTEAKNEAEAPLIEAQKAEEARIAKAIKAKNASEADLIEAQKAGEMRIAKAIETVNEGEAALVEAQKAEEARIAKATEAKSQAEAALTEAQKAVEEARAATDAKQEELAAARSAAAEAKSAGKAAAAALGEATRRLKPLSVFISRKTGRLYVRQNFEPLFDAPVSIRDADREIGTHLYVSTRAAEDGSALHWQAVSMAAVMETPLGRGAKNKAPIPAAAAPMSAPETAQGALDRLTIPEDTSQRLAALAWVGASVIISDYGISGETGATTDFIILTKPKASTR